MTSVLVGTARSPRSPRHGPGGAEGQPCLGRAVVAGLPSRLFDRRPRRAPGGDRLVRPLGRCGLRRVVGQPADRDRRSGDARLRRADPRRRTGLAGTAAPARRPGAPSGRPLHRDERHARRPPRDRAHAVVLRGGPPVGPVDRPAEDRHPAPLGRHRAHLRGHGRLQLVRAPRQPPGPDAVALPRAPPLAGGHERSHRLPHPPAHPRLVSGRADPGVGAARQRRAVREPARRLRGRRGLRPLEHAPGLRAPGPGVRQPELPPHPPPARRTAGRQPRLRADGLGPALPPCRVPECRDRRDRHRSAGATAHRRAGGRAATSSGRPGRAARRPVPTDGRGRGPLADAVGWRPVRERGVPPVASRGRRVRRHTRPRRMGARW